MWFSHPLKLSRNASVQFTQTGPELPLVILPTHPLLQSSAATQALLLWLHSSETPHQVLLHPSGHCHSLLHAHTLKHRQSSCPVLTPLSHTLQTLQHSQALQGYLPPYKHSLGALQGPSQPCSQTVDSQCHPLSTTRAIFVALFLNCPHTDMLHCTHTDS